MFSDSTNTIMRAIYKFCKQRFEAADLYEILLKSDVWLFSHHKVTVNKDAALTV